MEDPGEREAVYCTMLLSDSYLPGAMVLAHSLRDTGSKAKLVVLVTLDSLKSSTIDELKTIYNDIIPITQFVNRNPANLYLMDRPDLISTFSKIELWRQTQYSKIVYIDADVVSLRAPNELLKLVSRFAAVPDIGWPDCFNTGLMVLTPNMQDYYSLLALAERGISFDGADQGLLNMHFKKWDRLSFAYNCTPSGHYQYIPAFRHFGSNISLVHYIGRRKPWNLPRQAFPLESPYNQLLGRWWAMYDRHYRPVAKPTPHLTDGANITTDQEASGREPQAHGVQIPTRSCGRDRDQLSKPLEIMHISEQLYTQGHPQTQSYPPDPSAPVPAPAEAAVQTEANGVTQQHDERGDFEPSRFPEISRVIDGASVLESSAVGARPISPPSQPKAPEKNHHLVISAVPQYVHGEEHVSAYRHPLSFPLDPPSDSKEVPNLRSIPTADITDVPIHHHLPRELTDPINQPQVEQIITSSQEPEPLKVAPEIPFSLPRAEWDPSRAPPPVDSKPEAFNLPSQTYTMSQDMQLFQPPSLYPEAPKDMYYQVPPRQPETKPLAPVFPWEAYAPKPTRVFLDESTEPNAKTESHSKLLAKGEDKIGGSTGPASAGSVPSEDPWLSYTRSNAWDEVPEIERYMRSLQRPRRGQIQVLKSGATSTTGDRSGTETERRRPSLLLTDFPTEAERPSLPVTPAPIPRSQYMDEADSESTGRDKKKWGGRGAAGSSGADDSLLLAAGVPSQENWNPVERLEELHRRQSALLDETRGGPPELEVREIPRRRMPGEGGGGEEEGRG
ncbi:glycosyl transferase family 8 protein [Blastomyces dermatitidis ATCC 18188]|uniref:glycogenin glucosyltransferase n=1 Tax=Ajellomyces dermatitidis (strain ATCC 18188 / CBS 674.68) TaxID=653446 RepID=F2TA17_AJEDA|nr:glycosyl transferase family 8 protein [Blastomyces dermatitidis ATCC 18188]